MRSVYVSLRSAALSTSHTSFRRLPTSSGEQLTHTTTAMVNYETNGLLTFFTDHRSDSTRVQICQEDSIVMGGQARGEKVEAIHYEVSLVFTMRIVLSNRM